MKEHIKRRIEYSRDALPPEGTPAFESIVSRHNEIVAKNPNFKKSLDEAYKTAINTLLLQNSNGINLNIDNEVRHFLREFNHRSWSAGHTSMPAMFNVMEAFFNLDKKINYWELLKEEDYLISFFDFLDYYTSIEIELDLESIRENFQEDLIYNFNVGADLNEITFKTDEGNEFVIAGISLLRRGLEVTVLFLTGQIADTEKETTKLVPIPEKALLASKEKIRPAEDLVREATKLNNNPNHWKTLVACRLDLETQTIDVRYVARDEGNSYSITTDDITGFLRDGKWISDHVKAAYENSILSIKKYDSIFELAKACLYLPQYFNAFEEDITEENHDTQVKMLLTNPIKKSSYKNVEDKFKIRYRSLYILNRNEKFSPDRVILRDDKFKIETTGYWKELPPTEFGIDKKGRQITGKTWVNRIDSYFQADTDELIVSKKNQQKQFTGENAGFIYVMRNAVFEKNVFKIGLTTNDTQVREKQLSKTSVPDKFYTIKEWSVKDCKKAESMIHDLLKEYRVDPRREFFRIEMKSVTEIIDKVVDGINGLDN